MRRHARKAGPEGLISPPKAGVWRQSNRNARRPERPRDENPAQETHMSKPMTKTQLVAAIADAMESDRKTAAAALEAIATVVAREVAAGGTVSLPGLGKVACKSRPERQVRNPATGESMTKPADRQVKFAVAKALKDLANT